MNRTVLCWSYVVTPLAQKIKGLCTLVLNTHKEVKAAIELITAFLQHIAVHPVTELIVVIAFEAGESVSLGGPFEEFEDVVLGPQFAALKLLDMFVTTDKTEYGKEELINLVPRI